MVGLSARLADRLLPAECATLCKLAGTPFRPARRFTLEELAIGPKARLDSTGVDLSAEPVMRKNRQQSGQTLILAVFGLVVLLGAAGLAVDMGYLRYERRLQQSAADSAALAGAAALGAGAAYATAATDDATLNGFQDGQGNIHVTPTQLTFNGNANAVQVDVVNTYNTFFMRIFGSAMSTATVSVRAVAQYSGSRGCMYALKGGGGITAGGSIDIPNCGVIDDQDLSGGGSLTAASIGVHGSSSATTTPPAVTGILQAPDPLSYLPTPGGGGCTTINYTGATKVPVTLSQGVYCGISFSGPPNGFDQNVTFNPGTYVITGPGGLSFMGTGGHVHGTGVTFYLSGGAVNFGNGQRVRFTAPTNGTYAGILFFQDPGNAAAATINGAAGSHLQGAFYFPNATLNMNGAGTGAAYMIFVAKTLNLNTNINFSSDYTSLANGSPIKSAVLVE